MMYSVVVRGTERTSCILRFFHFGAIGKKVIETVEK